MLQLSAATAYRRQRLAAITIIDIADVVGRVWRQHNGKYLGSFDKMSAG